MNNIKIFTTQKHRFGRSLNVAGVTFSVDAKGFAEVPEDKAARVLASGFELADKDAKFTSEEELQKANDVQQILEAAKAQAAAIIAEAEKEAAKIIAAAKKEAGSIEEEEMLPEKEAKMAELKGMSNDELKGLLAEVGVPEADYAKMKKAELIDKIMSIIFAE